MMIAGNLPIYQAHPPTGPKSIPSPNHYIAFSLNTVMSFTESCRYPMHAVEHHPATDPTLLLTQIYSDVEFYTPLNQNFYN